jgi:hypothetical protein
MIGAIILTADSPQPIKIIKKLASFSNSEIQAQSNISLVKSNKKSGLSLSSPSLWCVILGLIIFIIIIILLYLAFSVNNEEGKTY